LLGKLPNAYAVAGIIGNLEQESGGGLNPKAQQDGSKSPVPKDGVGFGIAQWTYASRQKGLIALAKARNLPATDLGVQLDYLWQELSADYKNVLQHLKTTTSVPDATNQFVGPNNLAGNPVSPTTEVQRSGGYENPGKPAMAHRLKYANEAFTLYGKDAPTGGGTGATTSDSNDCSGGGSSNGSAAIDCATTGGASTSNLSQTRQNVVCLAQQELKTWKQPSTKPNELCKRYGADKGAQAPWCEEWCADFVSWIFDQAKYPLKPDPNWRIPAVASIHAIGTKNNKFHYHSEASYTPKPGDIVIHENGSSHTNIVVSVSGTTVIQIGGDQGHGPYGGPNSASVVSVDVNHGFLSGSISGYVSPD
jgi:hypothetical protein